MTAEPEATIFRPVIDARAHEHVVDQITFGIRSGVHRVGDKLPPIGELARQLGVSKPTISEAVRLLAQHGVVTAKRGVSGGVTVVSDDIPTALLGVAPERRHTDVRELLEARRAVECEIARLAHRRATAADLESLRSSIDLLEQHVGEPRQRLHYDHLFHYAMGRAARSDLLAYYQHQILKQLVVLWPEYFYEQEDPRTVIALHRRTLAALEHGPAAAVDAVMDEHLAVIEGAVERRAVSAASAPPAAARRARTSPAAPGPGTR